MKPNNRNAEGYADPTAAAALKHAQQSIRGRQSRDIGNQFEKMVEASMLWYEERGQVCVEKTPEPMKPLGKADKWGRFLACFTKKAQPDFKGTLLGGRSVVFEAKHTDGDRINFDRVTDKQADRLEKHWKLGAASFVLVSFRLTMFCRIPWPVWRDMKELYGRKYMTEAECERFRVKYIAGVIKLLDGVRMTPNDMQAGERVVPVSELRKALTGAERK